MMLQSGKQTIIIHILPIILKSEGYQTMKFGQLIECNIINIFLKKLYTEFGEETSPKPFSEKYKFSKSLDQ